LTWDLAQWLIAPIGHRQPPCRGGGPALEVMLGIGPRTRYSASPSMFSPFPYIFACLSPPLLSRQSVESKRERMKKLNCLSIQEKENTRLIHREKTILGEAEYHNRVRSRLPVPELGLLLSMGAGEADGGYKPPA
jgi:hypothetical protein